MPKTYNYVIKLANWVSSLPDRWVSLDEIDLITEQKYNRKLFLTHEEAVKYLSKINRILFPGAKIIKVPSKTGKELYAVKLIDRDTGNILWVDKAFNIKKADDLFLSNDREDRFCDSSLSLAKVAKAIAQYKNENCLVKIVKVLY